jgi:membrane protein implicated in regulation of membrane protease activity
VCVAWLALVSPPGAILLVFVVVLVAIFGAQRWFRAKQEQPEVQVKEKEIIRETKVVVKVRCPYCGNVYDETENVCPNCGAPRTR